MKMIPSAAVFTVVAMVTEVISKGSFARRAVPTGKCETIEKNKDLMILCEAKIL